MIDGISDDVSLMLGIMLLATGGIFQFISSFHIGFIAAEVQELVIGGCSCLFDASSCIFLFFNLIYENADVSMASIFCGFAVVRPTFPRTLLPACLISTRTSAAAHCAVCVSCNSTGRIGLRRVSVS